MNDTNRDAQLAFLEAYCAAHLDEGGLDDLVHDLKGTEAAAINNGGFESQLEYLLESLGAVEAAREVMGEGRELPGCFGAGAALRVGPADVRSPAESRAAREAVARAHDNQPPMRPPDRPSRRGGGRRRDRQGRRP